MFTESAELYDAIYFTFKDYAAEAAQVGARLKAEHPGCRTVLDVGCGTGEHARRLATEYGFAVDGIDLNAEFLRLARLKNPAGRFTEADMTDFALDRRYDAVICLFSSIGYVRTLANVERALACFRRHLAPGGVILVEPWFPPGVLTPGHHSVHEAQAGGVKVRRDAHSTIEGGLSTLHFEYTLEQDGTTRHTSEQHVLGLFTPQEMLAAFSVAGLRAVHEAASPSNRGLYVARAA